MERLGESTAALLEIAAIVGMGFDIDVLCEVAGWGEAETLRALDELVEGRFVRQGRRRRFGDYAFSHHLVQAAVYDAIPPRLRRLRHALVAHASARLYKGRPDRAAEIALHYDRGGSCTNAASAYAAAASRASRLRDKEALAHAQRALALTTDSHLVVEMQMTRAWAAQSLGRSAIVTTAFGQHSGRCPNSPLGRVPEIERLKTVNAYHEGRLEAARKSARRFLRAARANHDAANIFQAHLESGTVAIASDRYEEAEMHLRQASQAQPADDETATLRLMRIQVTSRATPGFAYRQDRSRGSVASRRVQTPRRFANGGRSLQSISPRCIGERALRRCLCALRCGARSVPPLWKPPRRKHD